VHSPFDDARHCSSTPQGLVEISALTLGSAPMNARSPRSPFEEEDVSRRIDTHDDQSSLVFQCESGSDPSSASPEVGGAPTDQLTGSSRVLHDREVNNDHADLGHSTRVTSSQTFVSPRQLPFGDTPHNSPFTPGGSTQSSDPTPPVALYASEAGVPGDGVSSDAGRKLYATTLPMSTDVTRLEIDGGRPTGTPRKVHKDAATQNATRSSCSCIVM
jgi:hypothetical protein